MGWEMEIMSSRRLWKVAQASAVLPVLALLASCVLQTEQETAALAYVPTRLAQTPEVPVEENIALANTSSQAPPTVQKASMPLQPLDAPVEENIALAKPVSQAPPTVRKVSMPLQPLVEKMDWTWREEESRFQWYVDQLDETFQVQMDDGGDKKRKRWIRNITISIRDKSGEPLTWQGHLESCFLGMKNGVIVYEDHRRMAQGCTVVAYDVRKGVEIWRTGLRGKGRRVRHSRYRNQINLRYGPSDSIVVFGKETAGNYIELLSIKTGETVGHRIVPRRPVGKDIF